MYQRPTDLLKDARHVPGGLSARYMPCVLVPLQKVLLISLLARLALQLLGTALGLQLLVVDEAAG